MNNIPAHSPTTTTQFVVESRTQIKKETVKIRASPPHGVVIYRIRPSGSYVGYKKIDPFTIEITLAPKHLCTVSVLTALVSKDAFYENQEPLKLYIQYPGYNIISEKSLTFESNDMPIKDSVNAPQIGSYSHMLPPAPTSKEQLFEIGYRKIFDSDESLDNKITAIERLQEAFSWHESQVDTTTEDLLKDIKNTNQILINKIGQNEKRIKELELYTRKLEKKLKDYMIHDTLRQANEDVKSIPAKKES